MIMSKLNYRHSLETINKYLKVHRELIERFTDSRQGKYRLLEIHPDTGNITRECGIFTSKQECAKYVNKKNKIYGGVV